MGVGVGSQRKRVILDFYATPVQNSTILEGALVQHFADVWRPVIVHTHQLWNRGSGSPRLAVRWLQSERGPVAGRAPPVLFWEQFDYRCRPCYSLVDGGGVWEERWSPSPPPFASFPFFPVRMRGMLVGGWRELGRKQGWRESWWWWWSRGRGGRGGAASDSAITSR